MSRTQILFLLAAGVFCVAVVVWGANSWVSTDRRNAAESLKSERADFARANQACPGRGPVRIEPHGPGWSYGPWIEVTCADGSKRAIR